MAPGGHVACPLPPPQQGQPGGQGCWARRREGSVPPALLGRAVRWSQPAPKGWGSGTPVQPRANWDRRAWLSDLPGWTRGRTGDGGRRGRMSDPAQCRGPPLPPSPPLPTGAQLRARARGVKIVQQQPLTPAPAPAGRGRAQLAAPPLAPAHPKIAGAGVTQPPHSHGEGPSRLLLGPLRQHSLRLPPAPSAAPWHGDGAVGAPPDTPFWGWLRS